jgi:Arc/MetJ-type ribon-helix-helix transcriptional regulator
MTTTDDPDDDTRSVEIPERTAAAVAERLPATEFDSIDEYVATALDRLLRELERGDHDHTGERSDERERDEAVTDRLESLGYL